FPFISRTYLAKQNFEWGQVGTATTPQVNGTGNKQEVGVFNRNSPMIRPVHPDSMRDNTLLVSPGFRPSEINTGMHLVTGNAGEANKDSWCSLASLHRDSEIPGIRIQQPAHTSLPVGHFRLSATTSSHSSNLATDVTPGTVERPYGCPSCNKKFVHESDLRRDLRQHAVIHTRKRAFACTLCEKSFMSRTDLQMHLNVHTGEKPFSCAHCGRRFSHSSNLKRHQKVHTGEKPYECALCGKQFSQLCGLKRHQRVHTGEKPFRCAQCGKQFSHSSNLKVHQSVHTGEKRFHCAQCGKNFSFLSNLIRHQAVHARK
uniref:C2H2-type domain-containing protein n=1 Tax=Salmo trutta TaxID=8032 RepID=A0A673Y450_SALTR